jgi:hypothetical protein
VLLEVGGALEAEAREERALDDDGDVRALGQRVERLDLEDARVVVPLGARVHGRAAVEVDEVELRVVAPLLAGLVGEGCLEADERGLDEAGAVEGEELLGPALEQRVGVRGVHALRQVAAEQIGGHLERAGGALEARVGEQVVAVRVLRPQRRRARWVLAPGCGKRRGDDEEQGGEGGSGDH